MSYTYPEALSALESIANDYLRLLRPNTYAPAALVCDATASTASVTWDAYGVRITMPVRAATSVMTQSEFEDWTAYMLHELGHPTHTDKAAWIASVHAGVSRMVNALEDVRMEKALIASGIVPNAKAVLSRLISCKVVEARSKNWKPNARREFGWTICVLGRAANGYALDASDLAWIKSEIKPGSTVETVMAWALPALAACGSTNDCVELAVRINAALAAPQQTDEQDEDGTSGQDRDSYSDDQDRDNYSTDGEGEAAEGEGEGEAAEGKGEGETPQEAPQGQQKGNEGDSEAGKGGKGHGDGTTDSDETPVSDNDQVERELSPQSDETIAPQDAFAEKAVLDILRDKCMTSEPKDNTTLHPRKMGAKSVALRDAAAQASRQRALLARALRANETDEREGGRKAGRLDRGALSRAVAGAPNVFARRDISEGYDTDVCVLLDASGSMGGEGMRSALEVGLIIAQAAGSVGASCTTEIFNSQGYRRAGGLASRRVPNVADYGVLVDAAQGGTPLSSHMARMAVAQAKRAGHKRRVVFVVTDGGCDYGPRTVKRMAAYLEQSLGTVMAHVSIGSALQGSFKAEVMVPYGKPLAEVGLEHFTKVLQAL